MTTQDKQKALAERTEPRLSLAERLFQFLAYAAVIAGLGVLVLFAVKLWSEGYWADGQLSLTNSGTVGDFIGGVAGSLFALAGVLLFYVALSLQRKEFRNSLQELRITSQALKDTEKHHRDTLQLMREEKEFGVCHVAVEGLIKDLNDLQYTKRHPDLIGHEVLFSGREALEEITQQWTTTVFAMQTGSVANFHPAMLPLTFDRAFGRFTDIWLLNRRLFSLYDAINEKLEGTWEREYLQTLINPWMAHMYHGAEVNVRSCLSGLEEIERTGGRYIDGFGVTISEINEWRKYFADLRMLFDAHK